MLSPLEFKSKLVLIWIWGFEKIVVGVRETDFLISYFSSRFLPSAFSPRKLSLFSLFYFLFPSSIIFSASTLKMGAYVYTFSSEPGPEPG